MGLLLKRTDMVHRRAEVWRPPLFGSGDSVVARIVAAVRRFLDLQNASIWRDLCAVLPEVHGAVLDVGCGAQPYRQLFRPNTKYLGIDTAESKAKFGYDVPDVLYFAGEVWPVEDSSVDFVLCTETLEHVLAPEVLLAQAIRCLTVGGTLLLTVPFAARWHYIPYDYWRFTPSSLENLLTRAGLSNIHVYARGNAVTVACYKVMALILRLVFPQNSSAPVRIAMQIVSLPFLPLLVLLAVLANISLWGDGGDDCLGYTVIAEKPAP
jgi:SAM-dependent methyltransferase